MRVQVLTNAGALDRDKRLAVVSQFTELVSQAANDPSLTERTWVLLTEAIEGGWGLAGHANTNAELVDAARAQIARDCSRQGRRAEVTAAATRPKRHAVAPQKPPVVSLPNKLPVSIAREPNLAGWRKAGLLSEDEFAPAKRRLRDFEAGTPRRTRIAGPRRVLRLSSELISTGPPRAVSASVSQLRFRVRKGRAKTQSTKTNWPVHLLTTMVGSPQFNLNNCAPA